MKSRSLISTLPANIHPLPLSSLNLIPLSRIVRVIRLIYLLLSISLVRDRRVEWICGCWWSCLSLTSVQVSEVG